MMYLCFPIVTLRAVGQGPGVASGGRCMQLQYCGSSMVCLQLIFVKFIKNSGIQIKMLTKL